MELNLKRPVVFFDLETTGTNITRDRIVEISIIKVWPDGHELERTRRINPEMPIPAEATAMRIEFLRTGAKGSLAIDDIVVGHGMTFTDVPVEYFNLQGMRIARPAPGQVVIRRQGASVQKIIIKK